MKSAQKTKATTQKFIGIKDIAGNTVILSGASACLIIEVQATNFALLSKEEQETRLLSYASLLNSLSFPIQILIRSKRIDISSYLRMLAEEIIKSQNELLKERIKLYKDFVGELVKTNEVLDKKFYIVIPYSFLEGNLVGKKESFLASAQTKLTLKGESLHNQLKRLNLKAKTLEKEELVKLFYEIYNGETGEINAQFEDIRTAIVKKEEE